MVKRCTVIMLNILYKNISWNNIDYVGFDLDGTLYDEFDFIDNSYSNISNFLEVNSVYKKEYIKNYLIKKWLIYGSSYRNLFDDILDEIKINKFKKKILLKKCIDIHRESADKIVLSKRVSFLLDQFKKNFHIFLVTDGNCELQNQKYYSLGLDKWFKNENVLISGCKTCRIDKPDIKIENNLNLSQDLLKNPNKVVYFGDRSVDQSFCKNLGFNFIKVKNMIN